MNSNDTFVVSTTSGYFRGEVELLSPSVVSWKGIPYAAAPVGPNRWRSPQPYMNGGSSIVNATRFAPSCIGFNAAVHDFTGSEDCLYLNVWSPAAYFTTSRDMYFPVIVWIVGGGMASADASNPTYTGRLFVSERESVVYVTFSYRVAAYGFYSNFALKSESQAGKGYGNYGIEDQRAVLQWVRANIAAFGGDPFRVTIQGESAGAHSVCYHLVSPPSLGLFQAAILESGSCDSVINEMDPLKKQSLCDAFMAAGASVCPDSSDLSCLRTKLNTSMINRMCLSTGTCTLLSPFLIGPSFDSYNLPNPVLGAFSSAPFPLMELIAQGASASVPILVGFNKDEFALSALLFSDFRNIDAPAYQRMVVEETAGQQQLIDGYMRLLTSMSPLDAAIKLKSEKGVICPARRLAQIYAKRGLPVYVYSFDHVPRHSYFQIFPQLARMVFHSAELPFVFGVPGYLLVTALDADEMQLGSAMRRYWLSFAESLTSTNSVLSATSLSASPSLWPRYTSLSQAVLSFNVTSDSHPLFQVYAGGPSSTDGRCLLWDALVDLGKDWNNVYNSLSSLSPNGGTSSTTQKESTCGNAADSALILGSLSLTLSIMLVLFTVMVITCRRKIFASLVPKQPNVVDQYTRF
jgi:para-nitrobenzyl esterase